MTLAKGQYDPIKAVEGMFNGSVTRIAQALKDPAGYSPSTKTILAECAKRFHDALDDCEIQLLDAKWYLEHQLRTNRARREAIAREMGTAVKRKHEEIQNENEATIEESKSAKKAKVEQASGESVSKDQKRPEEPVAVPKPSQPNGINTNKSTDPNQTQKVEKDEKSKDIPLSQPSQTTQASQSLSQQPQISQPLQNTQQTQSIPSTQSQRTTQPIQTTQPAQAPVKVTEPPKTSPKEQPPLDDFAKPTPQATPTGTNDDFNLESMFGDPIGDATVDVNNDDNDLGFDFTTGDTFGVPDEMENQDPASLDSLLPGLESYANQADDNLLSMTTNTLNNNTSASNTQNVQDLNALPTFSNDFDLPDIGGPNVFDDFLNDDSLGGGGDGGGMTNFDNINLSDSAMYDIDFDSFK